jgi:hypothetical protein
MPKVTKRKVNTKNNESLTNEDQPIITIVDKTDESKSTKGIKRKASASVEKVNKLIYEIVFSIINFILEYKKGFNSQ